MKTMSIQAVLDWLLEHHPKLAEAAEVERNWVWLADVNLKEDAATRESIKSIGFSYKRHGDHQLPSGRFSRWAHHCQHPVSFKFKRGGSPSERAKELTPEELDALVMAELGIA